MGRLHIKIFIIIMTPYKYMKNKDLPVIFIFDLDSTLIGQSSAIYNGYKTLPYVLGKSI
jgi:hypothetical protein